MKDHNETSVELSDFRSRFKLRIKDGECSGDAWVNQQH
jgi:hypothetical protein